MSRDDRPFDHGDDHDHQERRDGYDDHDEPVSEAPPAKRSILRGRSPSADAEDLLRRVVDLVEAAKPIPMSASARIDKVEVLDLLDEALERLPTELREARWLRKERDEYLSKMQADGEEIVEAARARAERMVQRTEVVKAAEHRARRILDGADAEARRLRLECEDFCDQRLAGFEIVLERTLKVVGSGREKLQASNRPVDEHDGELGTGESAFFDQGRP
jgi:hypothetical protein